jgi:hypothetical protein
MHPVRKASKLNGFLTYLIASISVNSLTRLPLIGYAVRTVAALARAPKLAAHIQSLQADVDRLLLRVAEQEGAIARVFEQDIVISRLSGQLDDVRLNLRDEVGRRVLQRSRDAAIVEDSVRRIVQIEKTLGNKKNNF